MGFGLLVTSLLEGGLGSDIGTGAGLIVIGAGLAAIGAGLGIGRLADGANQGIARQPEAVGDIRGLSIIMAAFIEGVALFAIVVGIMAMGSVDLDKTSETVKTISESTK